jgi:hypothetical protein
VKTTTHYKVSRKKLVRVLPEAFAFQVPSGLPEPITAVVFRDKVVTGRTARKAIERTGSDFGASLVFAARDFTQEACEAASASGVV